MFRSEKVCGSTFWDLSLCLNNDNVIKTAFPMLVRGRIESDEDRNKNVKLTGPKKYAYF